MKTPVAVFVYNRPEHTQSVLESLFRCRRVENCEFHFFSDGPKSNDSKSGVEATRKILYQWATKFNAQIIEQPHNLGLAKSIVTGVSDLCRRYGRVIVVEDDLRVSPDFLHYMIQSLDHYENEIQVMQVGGFTLSSPPEIGTDAFLLPITTTWGWATWDRAWQHFAWQPTSIAVDKLDKKWRELFDLHGTCTFSTMLEDRLAGRNDSWGILWWYAVSRRNGLVVYPKQSLVWNGGFDGSGIHCGSGDFLQQGDASRYLQAGLPDMLDFPSVIRFEPGHLSQLENFFRNVSNVAQSTKAGVGNNSKLKKLVLKIKNRIHHALY